MLGKKGNLRNDAQPHTITPDRQILIRSRNTQTADCRAHKHLRSRCQTHKHIFTCIDIASRTNIVINGEPDMQSPSWAYKRPGRQKRQTGNTQYSNKQKDKQTREERRKDDNLKRQADLEWTSSQNTTKRQTGKDEEKSQTHVRQTERLTKRPTDFSLAEWATNCLTDIFTDWGR